MSDEKNPNLNKSNRFLAFSLGQEDYAIPLLSVKEVIGVPEITPVPYTPPHFLGIMNLRGQVISVLDLRMKFNVTKKATNAETSIIICDLFPLNLGIVVDSINSVLTLNADEIKERPHIQSSKSSDYIMGVANVNNQLTLLLDVAKALSVEDQTALGRSSGKNQEAA